MSVKHEISLSAKAFPVVSRCCKMPIDIRTRESGGDNLLSVQHGSGQMGSQQISFGFKEPRPRNLVGPPVYDKTLARLAEREVESMGRGKLLFSTTMIMIVSG